MQKGKTASEERLNPYGEELTKEDLEYIARM